MSSAHALQERNDFHVRGRTAPITHKPTSQRAGRDLAADVREELDLAADMLRRGAVEAAMARIFSQLLELRAHLSIDRWRWLVRSVIHPHPAMTLIHESPFASRAFQKPRGYSGDAITLDIVYRNGPLPAQTSPLGRRIAEYEMDFETARAIRSRLALITAAIDDVARVSPGSRVLSVACGHLREAQRSIAVADGAIGEFIAVDQDPASLERVASEQPSVTTTKGSVRQIVTGALRWQELDLIYSCGLYDYLSDRLARALTRQLFVMLRPGGRLIIANMTPVTNAAYLEAMTDWWMVYRDDSAVRALAATIPRTEIASSRSFSDATGHVVLHEVVRA